MLLEYETNTIIFHISLFISSELSFWASTLLLPPITLTLVKCYKSVAIFLVLLSRVSVSMTFFRRSFISSTALLLLPAPPAWERGGENPSCVGKFGRRRLYVKLSHRIANIEKLTKCRWQMSGSLFHFLHVRPPFANWGRERVFQSCVLYRYVSREGEENTKSGIK